MQTYSMDHHYIGTGIGSMDHPYIDTSISSMDHPYIGPSTDLCVLTMRIATKQDEMTTQSPVLS